MPPAKNDPHMAVLALVCRHPNSEELLPWPKVDHEKQYLQLNLQPEVGRALKASRYHFWTKTVPQNIHKLEHKDSHMEL